MLTLEVDILNVPLFFRVFYLLGPKIEIVFNTSWTKITKNSLSVKCAELRRGRRRHCKPAVAGLDCCATAWRAPKWRY